MRVENSIFITNYIYIKYSVNCFNKIKQKYQLFKFINYYFLNNEIRILTTYIFLINIKSK